MDAYVCKKRSCYRCNFVCNKDIEIWFVATHEKTIWKTASAANDMKDCHLLCGLSIYSDESYISSHLSYLVL